MFRVPSSHRSAFISMIALLLLPAIPPIASAAGPSGSWSFLTATPQPSPRMLTASAYDPVRNRMIIFGGHPPFLGDVWALPLSGPAVWEPIVTHGEAPSARYGATMIYDSADDRLILFGGY